MGRWGGSVAEHGPWQLVGERVPALDPLVLVLQAIKPVLQALALGIDAQNHAACRGEPRGSQDTVTSDSQGLSGTSTPWHPSQTLCSTARLSPCPPALRVDCGLTATLLEPPLPQSGPRDPALPLPRTRAVPAGQHSGSCWCQGSSTVHSHQAHHKFGATRAQSPARGADHHHPLLHHRLLCASARPLSLSGPLSLSLGVRLDHVYGPNSPHRPGRRDCGLIQGPCPLLNPGWACC